MASEFEQEMTEANDEIMTTFGDSVTYTPKGGQGQSITAIAGPIGAIENEDGGDEVLLKFRTITVALADIAAPAVGDIVTVGGVGWEVVKPPDILSGIAELQCRWDQMQSKQHETHKRKLPVE